MVAHLYAVSEAGVPVLPVLLMAVEPDELDMDGRVDSKGVRYFGKGKRVGPGLYRVLAQVGPALCVVEAKVTFSSSGDAGG